MAKDGIALAESLSPEDPADIQTLSVEYTAVLNEIKKASEVLEMGELEELTVKSGSLTFLIRLINEEYFKNNPSADSFSIDVWADIVVHNDVRTIELTKGPDFI